MVPKKVPSVNSIQTTLMSLVCVSQTLIPEPITQKFIVPSRVKYLFDTMFQVVFTKRE